LTTLTKEDLESKEIDLGEGVEFNKNIFKKFVVSKDNYFIIFDDYEIASHAAGDVGISIPWNQISDILNKNFNISDL
jgi:hypothetical protein